MTKLFFPLFDPEKLLSSQNSASPVAVESLTEPAAVESNNGRFNFLVSSFEEFTLMSGVAAFFCESSMIPLTSTENI